MHKIISLFDLGIMFSKFHLSIERIQSTNDFHSQTFFHKKKQNSMLRLHGNTIGKCSTLLLSIFFWFYFTRKAANGKKKLHEKSKNKDTTRPNNDEEILVSKTIQRESFSTDKQRNETTYQRARLSCNPFYAPPPRYSHGMAVDSNG